MSKTSMLIFLLVLLCVGFSSSHITGQDSQQSEAKKASRDAKYSEPHRPGLVNKHQNGVIREMTPPLPLLTPTDTDLSPLRSESVRARNEVICSSDVIVRGVVSLVNSYITSDDTSIYSVYKVKVTERLRGDVASDEIEVTGPGGVVYINGKQFAYKPYMTQLKLAGDYVLFLRYDKGSGDYQLIQNEGIYDVMPSNGVIRSDAKQPDQIRRNADIGVPNNFDSLTTEVRSTVCK